MQNNDGSFLMEYKKGATTDTAVKNGMACYRRESLSCQPFSFPSFVIVRSFGILSISRMLSGSQSRVCRLCISTITGDT